MRQYLQKHKKGKELDETLFFFWVGWDGGTLIMKIYKEHKLCLFRLFLRLMFSIVEIYLRSRFSDKTAVRFVN